MKIKVIQNVLQTNDAVAEQNRQIASAKEILMVNIMSAPGSGKTTLLVKTLVALGPSRCAVLVGDLQTSRDAERLCTSGAQVIQINTGRGCHLSASEVAKGLEEIKLEGLSYLFIENVGNMVCPASFDLGEHRRVSLLSMPEGDDKVAKYWTLFQTADAILLSKKDLAGILDFDIERVKNDLARINTRAPFIEMSSKSGEGFEVWLSWLKEQHGQMKNS